MIFPTAHRQPPTANPSPFIRSIAVQFPLRRAHGWLQQVLLQVHDQPPVVRHRVIIIAERHPPEPAPDRSLDLGVVVLFGAAKLGLKEMAVISGYCYL